MYVDFPCFNGGPKMGCFEHIHFPVTLLSTLDKETDENSTRNMWWGTLNGAIYHVLILLTCPWTLFSSSTFYTKTCFFLIFRSRINVFFKNASLVCYDTRLPFCSFIFSSLFDYPSLLGVWEDILSKRYSFITCCLFLGSHDFDSWISRFSPEEIKS